MSLFAGSLLVDGAGRRAIGKRHVCAYPTILDAAERAFWAV